MRARTILIPALLLLSGCASSGSVGDYYKDRFLLVKAYQSLESADVFANHCGDGMPLTEQAIALYIITHTEHDDRTERLLRVVERGTVEGKLFALTALRWLDDPASTLAVSSFDRSGSFATCDGCIISSEAVSPELDAIASGDRAYMVEELESDEVIGGYWR